MTKLSTSRHDKNTRPISWIKAALKEFEKFPAGAQREILRALTVAAEGRKADTAKPMAGLGSSVYEVALAWRGEAYRTVYSVQMGPDLWVVHAFQKKSTKGSKTPKHEIELIRERIKRLKEMLT
ncbi:MAG: type II toxin-antitoxin system RelE/ParE family toxin [Gammaproteobacteria bacterium]